jgi:hypothetical protein
VLQPPVEYGSYTSFRFSQRLADNGILASMGSVGDSYDSALMENFWSTLKIELVYRNAWRTRDEAENALFAYIDGWSGYAGDLGVARHVVTGPGSPALVRCVHGLRSVSGSVAGRRWWRGCQGRASAAGCFLGVGRGSVAAQHGVGVRVRPEGVLHGRR